MQIDAISFRQAAVTYRQAAREETAACAAEVELRRDQRVEETREAQRSTPQQRAEAMPTERPALARAPASNRLLDILT